ncbi:glycerophosphodiester phosphodiesterase family protein [Flavicella marina]|uniref:glycerophosphodiester phosphodiesterase family protein n=1 Tax=Flavicella marina TaxID=1475951 RepID=UPI0012654A37|nr:glycerophosphodiester phosphodiesterase family protein [Flavicella marina]
MEKLDSKIIAHRGASFDAPENTLHAINLAWKQGIKKVEIDVHLTLDNKIIAFHDANTHKLTGTYLEVKNETYETLSQLDVGHWKGILWKNTKIPTLEDVLETIPKKGILVIEIKCNIDIVPILLNTIERTPQHTIEFISFDYNIVALIKKLQPKHKAIWLLDLDYNEETKKSTLSTNDYITKAKKANLDGLNVWAGKTADKLFIDTVKKNNLLVYTWTINNLDTAKHFLHLNVDAITTDRPSWLLQQLENKNNDRH